MFQNKRNVLNIYEIFVGGSNIDAIFWYKVWKQGCVCITLGGALSCLGGFSLGERARA